jgi:hypothetical protein
VTAPDLIAPVVGFRKWRVTGDHLSSPYVPLRWERAVVSARCYPANRSLVFGQGWLDEPHAAPHPDCRCGVYAYHRLPRSGPVPDPGRAFGVVAVWGRIEVHAEGVRAQHAAIRALGFWPELGGVHARRMSAIARGLGVDLVEHVRLPEMAREHGSPVPPALLPETAEPAPA